MVKGRSEGRAEGRSEGHAEGELSGLAQAILSVLRSRGLDVSPELEAEILDCRDRAVLDRWLARAALVESADELR